MKLLVSGVCQTCTGFCGRSVCTRLFSAIHLERRGRRGGKEGEGKRRERRGGGEEGKEERGEDFVSVYSSPST